MQKCGCSWQWVGLPHDMFVQYLNNPSLPRNNGNVIHHLTTFFVDPSIPSLPFSGDPTKMAWFDPSIWGLSENRVSQYVLMSQQSYPLVCKWICIYIYIYLFIYLFFLKFVYLHSNIRTCLAGAGQPPPFSLTCFSLKPPSLDEFAICSY
jgi:hypothetical protein